MGSRGPKPGFKQRRAEQAAAAATAKAPKAAAIKPAAASPIPDAQPAVPPVVVPPAESPVAAPAAPAAAPAAQPEAKKSRAKVVEPVLSAADRENPDKLSGQALRDLAHKRGLAKSVLTTMPDEKIRTELRYATYRQYEGEDALA